MAEVEAEPDRVNEGLLEATADAEALLLKDTEVQPDGVAV